MKKYKKSALQKNHTYANMQMHHHYFTKKNIDTVSHTYQRQQNVQSRLFKRCSLRHTLATLMSNPDSPKSSVFQFSNYLTSHQYVQFFSLHRGNRFLAPDVPSNADRQPAQFLTLEFDTITVSQRKSHLKKFKFLALPGLAQCEGARNLCFYVKVPISFARLLI